MTPKELHDCVVAPLREDLRKLGSEVHKRMDTIEAKADANTKFRYKVYGWCAGISLFFGTLSKYLF